MTKNLFLKLIEIKHWEPYIIRHELSFGHKPSAYAILGFIDHPAFECRFKMLEAKYILKRRV